MMEKLKIIYKNNKPYGIRDSGGFLFFFANIEKFTDQEERYRTEIEEQYRLADYLLNALQTYGQQQVSVEPEVKPACGYCKDCIFNLETDENSLVAECQLTIDEFTGVGIQFSRDFGCVQFQSKSV